MTNESEIELLEFKDFLKSPLSIENVAIIRHSLLHFNEWRQKRGDLSLTLMDFSSEQAKNQINVRNRPYWAMFTNNSAGHGAVFREMYLNKSGKGREESPGFYRFDLEKSDFLKTYQDRLVVHFPSTRGTFHNVPGKKVLAIRDEKSFPGYEACKNISLAQLVKVFAEPDRYADWINAFENVSIIYLISTEDNGGMRYVGSAYATDGVKNRWQGYAKSIHNGNLLLKDALVQEIIQPENLRFTILEILSKALPVSEVIKQESSWKNILLTNQKFSGGLNAN